MIQKILLRLGMDTSQLVALGMYLTFIPSVFSVIVYSISSIRSIIQFVSAYLVSKATVNSSDITYLHVKEWLDQRGTSTDCRIFNVTSKNDPNNHSVIRSKRLYSTKENHDDADDDRLGPNLKFKPGPGWTCFLYKFRLIFMNRKVALPQFTGDVPDESFEFLTFGRSPTCLRELFIEARQTFLLKQLNKTRVYRTTSSSPYSQKQWDQGRSIPSRQLSTVILPEEQQNVLSIDAMEYLDPKTRTWYLAKGIPYRRGYLLSGPPGTGKTSLSLALAAELKIPLYILSLSAGSLTDDTLQDLFQTLPEKCILLLEDIDCCIRHNQSNLESPDEENHVDKTSNKHSRSPLPAPNSKISFSTVLNAIDGASSTQGRILIMTTNHKERLDTALIRPGRVDMQIEFSAADSDILIRTFVELYSPVVGIESSTTGVEKEDGQPLLFAQRSTQRNTEENIRVLARKFANIVPPNVFTVAEIQGFLMSHKWDPECAVNEVQSWIAKNK